MTLTENHEARKPQYINDTIAATINEANNAARRLFFLGVFWGTVLGGICGYIAGLLV